MIKYNEQCNMNVIDNQRKTELLSFGKELLTFSNHVNFGNSYFCLKGRFLFLIMPFWYCLIFRQFLVIVYLLFLRVFCRDIDLKQFKWTFQFKATCIYPDIGTVYKPMVV